MGYHAFLQADQRAMEQWKKRRVDRSTHRAEALRNLTKQLLVTPVPSYRASAKAFNKAGLGSERHWLRRLKPRHQRLINGKTDEARRLHETLARMRRSLVGMKKGMIQHDHFRLRGYFRRFGVKNGSLRFWGWVQLSWQNMDRCIRTCAGTCRFLDADKNVCKSWTGSLKKLPVCMPDQIQRQGMGRHRGGRRRGRRRRGLTKTWVNGTTSRTSDDIFNKRWICRNSNSQAGREANTTDTDIWKMPATEAAKSLGISPLSAHRQPWVRAKLGNYFANKPEPSTFFDFGKAFCPGTCGYSCSSSGKASLLEQTPLGTYPGALTPTAVTSRMFASPNVVTNSLETISMSLNF